MKIRIKKFHAAFLALGLALALLGCGKEKDSDKVGNAQLCLDKLGSNSKPSEVDICVSKIDGVESASAYGLRCAGSFMKEGFLNPNKIINAMAQLNSGGGGTVNFMSLITFTSTANISTDTANSSTAFNYCLRGEGKGSTLMASFGFMAMSLYQFMNAKSDPSCADAPTATGYDFSTCATNFIIAQPAAAVELTNATSVDAATISLQGSVGAVIIATYNISCVGTAANSSLCTTISQSITSAGGTNATPRAVAVKFFSALLGLP